MDKIIVTKEMTSTVIRQFQFDTGTTAVRLIVPRSAIDADPSALTWTIRHVNADGDGDFAVPEVQLAEDAVLLRWVIGGSATAAVGTTGYCIRAVGIDGNGEELVWQSANGTILVEPSLDVTPSEEQQSALSELDDLILLVRGQFNGLTVDALQNTCEAAQVTAQTAAQTADAASAAVSALDQTKADKFPHPYALDGANLKEIFGSANALYAALAQEDYSRIRNLDYYPIRFNGTYRDCGEWVALSGTDYYSDTACKNRVGTVSADTVVSHEDASPAYYSATVSGTKHYFKMQDCQRWREKTINMTAKMEANINAYWGYGDSGEISGKVPHIMWLARDGIASLKFRSTNLQWADAVEQIETGDGSTAAYSPDDAALICVRYVCVDGVLQTYNTAYTVNTSTGAVTFKSGYIPADGAEIIISRTTHDFPWNGSAIYQTFNDPDHGLLRLIDDTEFASHIYGGAGGLGMRYAGETRTVANRTSVSWTDRGKMFLPTESEVWGLGIYGQKDTWYHLPQLAVFANGGRRRLSKAASDGGSSAYWWEASSNSETYVAHVNKSGYASSYVARGPYAAVPGFVGL